MLIADDDEGICRAVSRLLSGSCDVVGCAVDVESVLDAVERLHPDVVLLDFSLPGSMTGLDLCRDLAASTRVKIIAFTAFDDPDLRRMARAAGASGFLWKVQAASQLLDTISAVAGGTTQTVDDGSA